VAAETSAIPIANPQLPGQIHLLLTNITGLELSSLGLHILWHKHICPLQRFTASALVVWQVMIYHVICSKLSESTSLDVATIVTL